MIRTTLLRTVGALGIVAVVSSGCGRIVEKATEKAVEQAVENDTGENVEIDFSEDGISIESDEGDFTFSADEDGVQIDGTDADGNDFSLDADEDGVQAESEDGSFDLDDDGTFTVTGEDGDVFNGQVDDDGSVTVEGADGDDVFNSGDSIPDEWPSDIPQPEGLSDITGAFYSSGGQSNVLVSGTTSNSDAFDEFTDALVDAGFEEQSKFTEGDSASAVYLRGETSVSVSVSPAGDDFDFVVSIT